jgi:hypothetical protein
MKIATTQVQQSANEVLGVEVRNLYYLLIENTEKKRLIINVGKKTHDNVQALIDSETVLQTQEPEQQQTPEPEVQAEPKSTPVVPRGTRSNNR